MTLNGVIALTSPNRTVILTTSVVFGTDYVKVIEDTSTLYAAEISAKECSFQRYIIYCDIRGGYRERVRYRKSTPNYVGQYLLTVSESLVSV